MRALVVIGGGAGGAAGEGFIHGQPGLEGYSKAEEGVRRLKCDQIQRGREDEWDIGWTLLYTTWPSP
jgi:hypothetical protein